MHILGHNATHERRDLARRVILASLLARVHGKLPDKKLIDVTKFIIPVTSVNRNQVEQIHQIAQVTVTRKLPETNIQRLKHRSDMPVTTRTNRATEDTTSITLAASARRLNEPIERINGIAQPID